MVKRFLKLLLWSGGVIFFFAVNATAEIRPRTMTLTPQAGVMVFEGNLDLNPGFTWGLGVGYNFDTHWGAEGVLTSTYAREENGSESLTVTTGHLDLLYHFQPKNHLVPYVSLAAGGMRFDDDKNFLAGYGAGVKYFFAEDLALRFDLKHLLDVNDRDTESHHELFNTLVATAGLYYQDGLTKPAPVCSDSDGDGVIDTFDRCPDTFRGTYVDGYGCPVVRELTPEPLPAPTPAPVPLPVKPMDSDHDGVNDDLDRCPGTAAGVVVDRDGCPVPPPPAPPVVVEPEPSITVYLEYPTNKSDVAGEFVAEMQRVAEFIKEHPGHRFAIEGHADNVGTDADNMKLSLLRAEKARTYLTGKMGMDSALFETNGFGESRPVGDNNTDEGRQRNRRVVITTIPR